MSTVPHDRRGWLTVTTAVILLLGTVSTLLGLLRPNHYADPAALLPRLVAQDAVILIVALPVLTAGLWLIRRDSNRGKIIWLGALAFMTYIWATYALTVAFNAFFLGYLALFSLSLFTLVGGFRYLDPTAIEQALTGRLHRRVYAGFLGFAGAGLGALWLSEIIAALLTGTVPAAIEAFGAHAATTYLLDLGIVVPSLFVAAGWLWQGRTWGYVLAGVLLVFAAILAPVITAITLIDAQSGIAMSGPVIAASIVPPVIGAGFAGGFLYRMSTKAD